MSDRLPDHEGYPVTHCWYYHLGGRIPYPKEILAHVRECGSRGYLYNDIQEAGQKPEPYRARLLAKLEAKIWSDLRRDLTAYRHCVRELRDVRAHGDDIPREPCCKDIHVGVSLTFAHVYGGFANLETIRQLGSRQLDLFGNVSV